MESSSPAVIRGEEEEQEKKLMLIDVLRTKLNVAMTRLLEAAKREEVATVFRHLSQQVCVCAWQ